MSDDRSNPDLAPIQHLYKPIPNPYANTLYPQNQDPLVTLCGAKNEVFLDYFAITEEELASLYLRPVCVRCYGESVKLLRQWERERVLAEYGIIFTTIISD